MRKCLVYIAFMLFACSASAETIIVFLNGISGNQPKSAASATRTAEILAAAGYRDQATQTKTFFYYNSGDGFIEDDNEMAVQSTMSAAALQFARGDQPSAKVGGDLYKYYLGKYYNDLIANGVPFDMGYRDAAIRVVSVVKDLADKIDLSIDNNTKWVIVSHSQGNFHAEAVDAYLRFRRAPADNARYDSNLRFVGVASVAASTPNGRYVSITEDRALSAQQISLGSINYSILPRTLTLCETFGLCQMPMSLLSGIDITIHGYLEIYTNQALYGVDLPARNIAYPYKVIASYINTSLAELNLSGAIKWDVVADFSLQSNPSGPWRYGYQAGSSPMQPMGGTGINCSDLGMPCWKISANSVDIPMVAINNTGATVTRRTVVVPNGVLVLHPGINLERALVTWTAPESGTYAVSGAFQVVDVRPTNGVNVSVAVGESPVLEASIVQWQSQQPFNFTRTLAKGQVVSFSVDAAGNYGNDSTALSVNISKSAAAAATACNSSVKSLVFAEDFASSLDLGKWSVSENGGTVRSGVGSITLSTVGSADKFPFVSTNSDVIPASGNFSLFCRAKYDPTNPYGAGACVASTNVVSASDHSLYDGYIGVWGGANLVYSWGFDSSRNQLYFAQLGGGTKDFHDYETCVINGEVTAYIDGALVAKATVPVDKLRPKRIWLGHPGNTAAPNNWVTVETAKIEVRQLQ